MKISTTRIDSAQLNAVVTSLAAELDRLEADFEALLPTLTAADRKTVPRTRTGFPEAARTFAQVMSTRPDIEAVAEFDRVAVLEDLDNVAIIDPLVPRVEKLAQRLQDSRLKWLAEAQEPTLAAYGVAKARALRDGTLQALIEPLQQVLANRPRSRAEDPAEASPTTDE
jgi:hypothetical protein